MNALSIPRIILFAPPLFLAGCADVLGERTTLLDDAKTQEKVLRSERIYEILELASPEPDGLTFQINSKINVEKKLDTVRTRQVEEWTKPYSVEDDIAETIVFPLGAPIDMLFTICGTSIRGKRPPILAEGEIMNVPATVTKDALSYAPTPAQKAFGWDREGFVRKHEGYWKNWWRWCGWFISGKNCEIEAVTKERPDAGKSKWVGHAKVRVVSQEPVIIKSETLNIIDVEDKIPESLSFFVNRTLIGTLPAGSTTSAHIATGNLEAWDTADQARLTIENGTLVLLDKQIQSPGSISIQTRILPDGSITWDEKNSDGNRLIRTDHRATISIDRATYPNLPEVWGLYQADISLRKLPAGQTYKLLVDLRDGKKNWRLVSGSGNEVLNGAVTRVGGQ
ncbi:hypothetical protein BH09SUM1_BH09SUM1_09700 [soil metagenome]